MHAPGRHCDLAGFWGAVQYLACPLWSSWQTAVWEAVLSPVLGQKGSSRQSVSSVKLQQPPELRDPGLNPIRPGLRAGILGITCKLAAAGHAKVGLEE